jgi:cell division protein FtsQ
VSTPKDGQRATPRRSTAATGSAASAGAPRERNAAAERAMRKRSRREGTASRTDRPSRTERPGRARPAGRVERGRRVSKPANQVVLTRRRVLVRRSVALTVVVGLVVVVAAVLWTPLLGVRSVQVSGEQLLTADQVEVAAQVPSGTPMLRLDTDAIKVRVHQLARVATVDVSREWPSTVRISITERDPVGVVVERDGAHLVDRTGLDYATLAVAPTGLPRILLGTAASGDPRVQAVVRVLTALPAQLRSLVVTVSAKTPGSVTLGLSAGRSIRWGSADDSARKAAVLAALMTRPGKVYDVSSPDLPTVS